MLSDTSLECPASAYALSWLFFLHVASGGSCCQRLTAPAMDAPRMGASQNSQSCPYRLRRQAPDRCFAPENLTDNQKVTLKDLLQCNLKTIRAYLLKEDFQNFWDSPAWASKFMDQWCTQVMRSKLEPMKKVAKTIRAHKHLITVDRLNSFIADPFELGGKRNK
jgi:hypothetical protein